MNGPGGGTSGIAGQPTATDLEDLDGLDLVNPEYVLTYIPPYVRAEAWLAHNLASQRRKRHAPRSAAAVIPPQVPSLEVGQCPI